MQAHTHPRSSGAGSRDLDLLFSALSNPTRRAILARLSRGESTVTELARPFDMSLPAISKHLRILEDAHVVKVVRDGRTHRCSLAPNALTKAAKWLRFYTRMWEGQLDSLSEYLRAAEGGRPDGIRGRRNPHRHQNGSRSKEESIQGVDDSLGAEEVVEARRGMEDPLGQGRLESGGQVLHRERAHGRRRRDDYW